jgi:hypothetical protein
LPSPFGGDEGEFKSAAAGKARSATAHVPARTSDDCFLILFVKAFFMLLNPNMSTPPEFVWRQFPLIEPRATRRR